MQELVGVCRCGVLISRTYDVRECAYRYQHGSNAEAVLVVSEATLIEATWNFLAEWLDRVHAYENLVAARWDGLKEALSG